MTTVDALGHGSGVKRLVSRWRHGECTRSSIVDACTSGDVQLSTGERSLYGDGGVRRCRRVVSCGVVGVARPSDVVDLSLIHI